MDLETKALIMAAVNRMMATRVRLVAAESADAVSTAPSPYGPMIEREQNLLASQEEYLEKLLDEA